MSAAQKVAGNTLNIKLYAWLGSLGPFNGHSNIFDYSFRSASLISLDHLLIKPSIWIDVG